MTGSLSNYLAPEQIKVYDSFFDEPIKEEFFIYGKGPDPIKEVDQSLDPITRKMTEFCFAARKEMILIINKWHRNLSTEDFSSHFSAGALKNLDKGACAYLEKAKLDFASPFVVSLNTHSAPRLFKYVHSYDHTFVVATVNEHSFIIDLTIRQYIEDELLLKREDKNYLDQLLEYGFLELNSKTASFYNRLFEGISKHHNCPSIDDWYLPLIEANPILVEDFISGSSKR